jgi:ketosteroid isomerase-like protein
MSYLIGFLVLLMTASIHTVSAAPVPPAAIAEAQLRAINHRFVNAFAVADHAYIEALTAKDFLLISNSGDWVDRARHLEMMRKPTASGGVAYDDVRVRFYGAVAVLQGYFEAGGEIAMEKGGAYRVRYTDVYYWTGANWQLVGAQNTPLRDGVVKAQQFGVAPVNATWRGTDPKGEALEVLTQLNENYVRAYREADVAWYDAHLSPDYMVIGGDGSLSDRAKALADFGKSSFSTHMRSFPVDKVQIRRFENIALIHAENAYEMKDGRKGVSRYTDIWHQQDDGRWLCIGAHITVHQAPA